MKYLALLGELGWRKLEERRKEMIEELFGVDKITRKSTARV